MENWLIALLVVLPLLLIAVVFWHAGKALDDFDKTEKDG